ncbi:unnamed protein product [Prorocentrum cordatum]|uniref:N-acetyltransferase domain-containing protein n=1 Tax=Prorocentrum cordatum TaxID=2364126 RepID=A0ABN9YF24_9DINO|nr:unnamed protein product [Polarella glacialis]
MAPARPWGRAGRVAAVCVAACAAGCRLVAAAWAFPGRGGGRGPAGASPARRGRPRVALRSWAMSQVKGGSRLTRAAPAALLPIEEMGLKLCMPDLDDIPELAEAMWGAFDRVQVRVGDWVPFSEVVNSVKGGWERKDLSQDLAFRLGGSLQFASLLRPVRAESIALLVRQSRDSVIEGPIAAYFELSLLPPDGRRPEAEGDGTLPSTILARPEPYLTNLFVTPRSRRQGLGRAMVQVAEDIWKSS